MHVLAHIAAVVRAHDANCVGQVIEIDQPELEGVVLEAVALGHAAALQPVVLGHRAVRVGALEGGLESGVR